MPSLEEGKIAEVGGVRRDYIVTYSRYGKINAAIGYATALFYRPSCGTPPAPSP